MTHSICLILVGAAMPFLANANAAEVNWERDFALRGLTELRVEVVPGTDDLQSVRLLVRKAVTKAVTKAGLKLGGDPVMFVELSQAEQDPTKSPIYYIVASVSEKFLLKRDPTVSKSEWTWEAREMVVVTGDRDGAILRGVEAVMAKFVESLKSANAESDGGGHEAPKPGT